MSDAPVGVTCKHYSVLIEGWARTLERLADVQNGLALECESPLQAYLALALFRALRDSSEALEEFLKGHDPDGTIKPPVFVLHPPFMAL